MSRGLVPLLLLGVLFADESLACSCIRQPDIQGLESDAELVVLAKLKSRNSLLSFGKKKYVFTVLKTFKGSAIDRVVVWTVRYETACGLNAKRDVPYVLFVFREEKKLMVDHCSSWPLSEEYSGHTNAFNNFYKLTGPNALEVD